MKLLLIIFMPIILTYTNGTQDYNITINKELKFDHAVMIEHKGNITLGKHFLDIYIPIELRSYRDSIHEFLQFLISGPITLHENLIALRVDQ